MTSKGKVKPLTEQIKEALREYYVEWLQENKPKLKVQEKRILKEFVDNVCSDIVGQSYINFDSNATYFPTITFKFKNVDPLILTKYSQIQIRYLKEPDQINDAVVKILKQKAFELKSLRYTKGAIRANYIAEHRYFKTTIFVHTKEESYDVLFKLLTKFDLSFDKKQFSFTERSERQTYTRAKKTPQNIQINPQQSYEPVEMQLHKVVLAVNGWDKQIILYK